MKKLLIILCVLCATVVQAQEYSLVWNEDFTDGTLDTQVWNIEVNGDGGGNNELQYYCQKGVSVGAEPTTGKQCLILTATKEDYQGKKCTAARRISSRWDIRMVLITVRTAILTARCI